MIPGVNEQDRYRRRDLSHHMEKDHATELPRHGDHRVVGQREGQIDQVAGLRDRITPCQRQNILEIGTTRRVQRLLDENLRHVGNLRDRCDTYRCHRTKRPGQSIAGRSPGMPRRPGAVRLEERQSHRILVRL